MTPLYMVQLTLSSQNVVVALRGPGPPGLRILSVGQYGETCLKSAAQFISLEDWA